jgi:hypothetical protein
MFERIEGGSQPIQVEPARGRQTADNSFGAMVERGAQVAASAIGGGMRAVAPLVPGGAFLSAVADAVDGAAAGLGGAAGAGGGGDRWALLRAQERLQAEGLSNSLQLLALQRKMHQEKQQFTAVSNVLKARHEMAQSAIRNIG